ncbi:MAG: peptidase M14, partial [Proteobacteria bacterium]|nr:peptidase M14 [Pseudomonadota bacterium]
MNNRAIEIDYFNDVPAGFLSVKPSGIRSVLPNPSIIYIKGRRQPPLYVSILLHGNEVSGLLAMQRLLNKYERLQRVLPRSLIIFVGNVEAAERNIRHLPDRPDFNRIWGGQNRLPEEKMAQEVIDYIGQQKVFASIDIHNNTGKNPLYACVNHLENHFINLASLFSRTLVYFTDPSEVHSNAFAAFGPSVTLECGLSGEEQGVQHVQEFIDDCLHLDHIMDRHIPNQDIQLFHTVSKIRLPE